MGKKKRAKKAEAKAAKLKKSLAATRAELDKSQAKLAKAKDKAARWKEEAKTQRGSSESGSEASAGSTSTPDETWTVAQLRDEARARGLSGMSNKPKAELLRALS